MRVEAGDVPWMLAATAPVWLMLLPGLALSYGAWAGQEPAERAGAGAGDRRGGGAVVDRSGLQPGLAEGNALVGGLAKAGLAEIGPETLWPLAGGAAIPKRLFAAFQMTFAAVTAALVVGALVERVRFGAMLAFSILFLTLVYAPLAHMVWSPDGALFALGAIDFAGGTVVHINAGVAGLVGVAIAGPRIGYLKEAMPPHSLALTMVGTGLLWVAWFGFNAGSALGANGLAALALLNSMAVPAAGVLAWIGVESWRSGKASMLGGASGAVAGLVAITPAAGVSGPLGATLLGAAASLACHAFVAPLKNRLRWDDSLDVFGIHGLGGIIGSLGTALVALPVLRGHAPEGMTFWSQLGRQAAAVSVAILWSAAGSALAFARVRAVLPLRHEDDAEREGLDLGDHGERAYG